MAYVEIRDPHNPRRLLCRFDPERDLLEFKQGDKQALIDLSQYRPSAPERPHEPTSAPERPAT